MTKDRVPSRREFLASMGTLMIGNALLSVPFSSASAPAHEGPSGALPSLVESSQPISEFLDGASVYPDLQTRAEWNAILDHFRRAHMNFACVSESSWGNLEAARGVYEFGWLCDFLNDLEKQKMKAILGTDSYVPTGWQVETRKF